MIGEGAEKTGVQAKVLRDVRTWAEQKVETVRLSVSNVYLARGEAGSVLVDAGDPGNGEKIMEGLAKVGVRTDEVALILLTHGHVDHFGSAAELRKLTGAAVAIHEKDAENLRRGRNPYLTPTGLEGRLIKPFLKNEAPPVEPDVLLGGEARLEEWGVRGRGQTAIRRGFSSGALRLFSSSIRVPISSMVRAMLSPLPASGLLSQPLCCHTYHDPVHTRSVAYQRVQNSPPGKSKNRADGWILRKASFAGFGSPPHAPLSSVG